jgi:probable rRNA maturation factor
VNVAIVDDATIHGLNRRHLQHDYPTDVLSFPLEDSRDKLAGEIVVSAETAQREAAAYGWSGDEELCLYVVHGALHLAGLRDKTSAEKRAMRAAEERVLAELGLAAPHAGPTAPSAGSTQTEKTQEARSARGRMKQDAIGCGRKSRR